MKSTHPHVSAIIDDKLTFEQYVQSKVNKANSIMGIMRRTYTYLNETSFLMLYMSGLTQSTPIRSGRPTSENTLTALRTYNGGQLNRQEDWLHKIKLPILALRRLRGDMIEVYKFLTNKYDEQVSEGLLELNRCSTLGHDLKLAQKRYNKKIHKNSFSFRVVDTCNDC